MEGEEVVSSYVAPSHTPGPWTYEVHQLAEGFSAIVYAANGMRVGTDHLSEADARLIAAAPTMADYIRERAEAGCAKATAIWRQINANS